MTIDLERWQLSARVELVIACVIAWVGFVSVPLFFSALGLGWDALNHHIYLGWIADQQRFDKDFLAAGYQSLQLPYLYWPVYKLAALGAGPIGAGIALASLYVLAVPPVWMIARACLPGHTIYESAMRLMAVILAFISCIVISALDSTSNDLLAAVPLVWSIAFALEPLRAGATGSTRQWLILSGLLAGASVGCKLSNGPIAILLPLIWLFAGHGLAERLRNTVIACVFTVIGAVAVYGYWGAQMWTHFGNPVYPFYEVVFKPLRGATGWIAP